MSHLDREIPVSFFADFAAQSVRSERLSLRGLAARIEHARAATKHQLPWLKLALFGPERTDSGSLRHNRNVRQVHGVETDYDGGLISVQAATARLQAADITGIIYTSPSHTVTAPRWRILCPSSTPVEPAARERLVARLNGVFDGSLAAESFTLSQAYYFGSTDDGALHHKVCLVDGRRTIDEATDLDAGAQWKKGARATDKPRAIETAKTADVLRLAAAMAAIPNGGSADWNAWNSVAMAIWVATAGSEFGREILHGWSNRNESYDSTATDERWDHFSISPPTQIGAGTLFRMAQKHGWKDPERAGAEEFDLIDDAEPETTSKRRLISVAQCAEAPTRGYVLKDLIAPADVGCIFGAPGAGKSLLAPYLGYAVAQGRRAFGKRTRKGPVIYVAAEDPHGMQGRVRALKTAHGDAQGFYVADGISNLLDPSSSDLAWLQSVVLKVRPSLVIIDTLAMAFPGLEENSAEGMGRVVAAARSLARTGAAVILVHHDTKAEGGSPRGHSLFNGALYMALRLEARDEAGIIRGRLTKNRNGPCDVGMAFRIGVQDMGRDEDGDPITLPYAIEVDHPPPRKAPMTAVEGKAMEALRTLEITNSSVREELWREACASRLTASDETRNQNRAFKRVVEKLLERGLVFRDQGIVRSVEPGQEFIESDEPGMATNEADDALFD